MESSSITGVVLVGRRAGAGQIALGHAVVRGTLSSMGAEWRAVKVESQKSEDAPSATNAVAGRIRPGSFPWYY
jgi:hypothetical protein